MAQAMSIKWMLQDEFCECRANDSSKYTKKASKSCSTALAMMKTSQACCVLVVLSNLKLVLKIPATAQIMTVTQIFTTKI